MSYAHLQRRLERRGGEPVRLGVVFDCYSSVLRRREATRRREESAIVNEDLDALLGLENGHLRARTGWEGINLDVKDYKH